MTGIVKTDQLQGAQGTTVTVPTGNTLAVTSNATVGGTLGVTGAMTTAAITSTGKHTVNFNGGATQAFKYTDTGGGNLASFGQFYNTSDALIGNVQNANNDGIHLNIKNGSIVFSNIGYTAANALDDYEEGTFSPTATATSATISHSVKSGQYTKIGNRVFFNVYMQFDGTNSLNSNPVSITGFPFTTNSTGANLQYIQVFGRHIDLSSGYYNHAILLNNNTSTAILLEVGDNNSPQGIASSRLRHDSGQLYFQGSYRV